MLQSLRHVIRGSVYDPPQVNPGDSMDWEKWLRRILCMWVALMTGINLVFLDSVTSQILGVIVLLVANAWYLHHLVRLAQDGEGKDK